MKLCFLLVALLVCGTAQAADWVEAFHNNAGTAYFDASRLKIDGDIRSGWFKVVLPPHTRGVSGKYQTYMVALQSFDCRKETVRLDSLTSYFNDGSISNGPPDVVFAPVVPDTNGEFEMKFICAFSNHS